MPNMPEEERIKELKLLKSSYEMYEKSKIDTKTKMSQKMNADGSPFYSAKQIEEKLSLIQGMQDDVIEQYQMLGGNVDELKKKKRASKPKQATVMDLMNSHQETVVSKPEPQPVQQVQKQAPQVEQTQQPGVIYDVIPLPSKGECYPNKMSNIKVAYLTAYDENILVSPNLYRDNKVLDEILRNKLINSPIAPEDLLQGDRDAIILWLRATGYGNDFPITATDNETGKRFEAVVDLSKISFKPFNLKGDENGWFDFTTPVTKDKIKFKFLTSGDNDYLGKVDEEERMEASLGKLERISEDISYMVEHDSTLDRELKKKIFDAQNAINEWKDRVSETQEADVPFTNIITNRMQLMVMEVNGNRDRKFIHNYIMNMNVRDSSSFRKYVNDNEPGLDYNVEVARPESLGGGTVSVFLQLDQYLFLNTSE